MRPAFGEESAWESEADRAGSIWTDGIVGGGERLGSGIVARLAPPASPRKQTAEGLSICSVCPPATLLQKKGDG